jgi:hypothetical protein
MSRGLLAGIAVVVVAAGAGLIALVGKGGPPAPSAPAPTAAASARARPEASPTTADAIDAGILPTAAETAEARARVLAEYKRPPNAAPGIVKSNQSKKPMRQVRDLYRAGDYPEAIARAKDVLALEPEQRQARMYLVMAACQMGDLPVAQAYLDQMPDGQKVRAAEKCAKMGVTLARVPAVPPPE